MPQLLYIDTAGSQGMAAASVDGTVMGIGHLADAHEQAAKINFLIEDVLRQANTDFCNLNGICVCAGPGSYTGLRVGLSVAKGIAFVRQLPLMLFNTLDLIAAQLAADTAFALAIKARNGEFFFASYRQDKKPITAPRHIFEHELGALAGGLALYTDDELLHGDNKQMLTANDKMIAAEHWLPLAEERYALQAFDDLAYSEPFYLKAAYTTTPRKP
ncbi:MAG: tRNA (adenosine(37)-N6)-threonylcarbamoyltransferase complex dimerization subunit type 1 TsaB [Edaphocola sp.]